MLDTQQLIQKLRATPAEVQFKEVMQTIDTEYSFTATRFTNGTQINSANENNGSCKILAFAKLHELSAPETLYLFGDYYRIDVLENPNAQDHQNIRQFMQHGWDGVQFDHAPLAPLPR